MFEFSDLFLLLTNFNFSLVYLIFTEVLFDDITRVRVFPISNASGLTLESVLFYLDSVCCFLQAVSLSLE